MEVVQSYLVCLLEASCFILLYQVFWKSEYLNFKWNYCMWVICMSTAIFAIDICFYGYSIVQEIMQIIALLFGSRLLNKNSIKKMAAISIFFMLLVAFSDFLTAFLDIRILTTHVWSLIQIDIVMLLIGRIFLLIFVILIKQIHDIKRQAIEDKIEYVMVPFLSAAMCVSITLLVNGFDFPEKKEDYFIWCLIFSLLAMYILIVFHSRSIVERNYLLRERQLLEMDAKDQHALYCSLEEQIQRQKNFAHNYKSHLTYIQLLLKENNYPAIEEYLKEMNGEMEQEIQLIDVGHPIINTILNTKYQEAKRKGATVVCKMGQLDCLDIENIDLVILLSNLLNNAIEAIEESKKEKVLKIKMTIKENQFILSIRNSYDGTRKKIGDSYSTTKENKELHGIGIKNVIRIVKKYKGVYRFDAKEKEFCVTIMIPIEKKMLLHS